MTYIQPLLSLFILAVGYGAYRSWRCSRTGNAIWLALAALGLFLVAWLPVARLAERPFETHFPPHAIPYGDAQAIVVISGSMEPAGPVMHQRRVGSDTYARCVYSAWLYKHWRPLPVLASGGTPRDRPHETPDATVMQKVLEESGVPAPMIWCENRSHSTHENALYSAEALRDRHIQKIVLVTSAFQMLRAELCFRKEGLTVIPAACDYRTFAPYEPSDLFPCWKAIRLNENILHETLGLVWYWIHGWV
jgi:uncharacterized SAM-binding protein YcdF (DUF218 family)